MRPIKNLLWWITSVMGDNDYQRYLAHLRRQHPHAATPTEAEYWRTRYREADASPAARCC